MRAQNVQRVILQTGAIKETAFQRPDVLESRRKRTSDTTVIVDEQVPEGRELSVRCWNGSSQQIGS
jgi:hypothetical protein